MTAEQARFVNDLRGAVGVACSLNKTANVADLIAGLIAITVAAAYEQGVLEVTVKAFQDCADNVERLAKETV